MPPHVTPAALLALLLLGCRTDKPGVETDTGAVASDPDSDGDGYPASEDCDDNNSVVNPAAAEICDGIDNDCDGGLDEGVTTTYYADADADGFGDPSAVTEACAPPDGHAAAGNDCDDSDPDTYPSAAERCDGKDNDCDGTVDEDVQGTFYADADADGFGDPGAPLEDCDPPDGYVGDDTDCDDTDAASFPGGEEVCDGRDNDCDVLVDEGVTTTYYADSDGDLFGVSDDTTEACEAPTGYTETPGDCDDADVAISPAAAEACDEIDNDCDGDVDEGVTTTFFADDDGDRYGDPGDTTEACEAPSGYVGDDTDCDDADAAISPAASEVCDDADNDCDGLIDDDDGSLDTSSGDTWYVDDDGDGYGDPDDTTAACEQPSGAVSNSADCDDTSADISPDGEEICSGLDEDCDGVVDDLGPSAIYAGALSAGAERHYQYSPVTSGGGYLEANWSAEPAADSYELAVGTTAGDDDVAGWVDVGSSTSTTLTGLTLQGAWDDAEYYVSVRAVNGSVACDLSATSAAVQIAEAETWTGDVGDLRAPDSRGGYTEDWPEAGVDAVYGEHWFEEVDIGASATVRVQGWGLADGVSAGISSSASAVSDPGDGWISLYANDITIAGMLTASGRGHGGGGGGGAGVRGGYQGEGGEGGLGGDGGPASTSYAGGGGGGSPEGLGGVGAQTGGDGNLYGGGSGATGCSGSDGNDGGDGASGSVGGTGGTASSGSPGVGGSGEFSAGGGDGVSGCDNWSGGGGGGYGAGGGGGSQWAGSTAEASGGGAGGSGGSGGSRSVNGGAGAGAYGGSGGTNSGSYTGSPGTDGGYLSSAGNGDTSTDRSLELGSGGGGGSGGYQETGGGGGGAGGGAIFLYAYDSLELTASAYLLANGAGGGGGARDNGGSSTSAVGGVGAGGGILLEAQDLTISTSYPYISATGGDGQTSNGGTIKLFYDSFSGTTPSSAAAGRVYDAGSGSWGAP